LSASSDELERLNQLPTSTLEAALLRCCGSNRWVAAMQAGRPWRDVADLHASAARIWRRLGCDDWREAFRAHPRIGEPPAPAHGTRTVAADPARQDEPARDWSAQEQAGAQAADAAMLGALRAAHEAYEARFGHLFIVCATGKSAGEMLQVLEGRLGNDPEEEIRVAAEEQLKITHLRLDKLLEQLK
jgi:OHCU decarboxylase